MSLRTPPLSSNLFSAQNHKTCVMARSTTTHLMLWQFAIRTGTAQGLATSSLFSLPATLSPLGRRNIALMLRAVGLLGLKHRTAAQRLSFAQTTPSTTAHRLSPLLRPLQTVNRLVRGNLLARRASLLGFHAQLSTRSNRRPLGQVGGIVTCPSLSLTHSVGKLWNLFFFSQMS